MFWVVIGIVILICYALFNRLLFLILAHYISVNGLKPTKAEIKEGTRYALKHFLKR